MALEDADDVVVERHLLVVTHQGMLASGGQLRCCPVEYQA